MSILSPKIVKYCAQECAWQHSGEFSVYSMVEGWMYAHKNRKNPISFRDVIALGKLIEPQKNHIGLRRVDVRVGFSVKMSHRNVLGALSRLVDNQPEWKLIVKELLSVPVIEPVQSDSATEWFRQYEEIHPFVDGNGRTGSLLYNWMRGSLDNPIHAPNLWNDSRRRYEGYPALW